MLLAKVCSVYLFSDKKILSPKFGRKISIISGGTAANFLVRAYNYISWNVSYILGISDNGGSSAEVTRVLKGPAIGDIRSRLIRLAKVNKPESKAIYKILSHRLDKNNKAKAIAEWFQIMDTNSNDSPTYKHELWKNIPRSQADIIFAHFKKFQEAVDASGENFDFRNGNLGNFFFSGSRLLYSMDTAIYLFSKLIGIPEETSVLPVIHSENAYTIAAELQDGSVIQGQNEISHPGRVVDKNFEEPLPSSIKRIFYIDDNGDKITPKVNSDVINSFAETETVVYSIGSLYTSIMPCLILPGVGEVVSAKKTPKVMVLNGSNDRETSGMSAVDYINAITSGLNRYGALKNNVDSYITHLIVPETETIKVDKEKIEAMGIKIITVSSKLEDGCAYYDKYKLVKAVNSIK